MDFATFWAFRDKLQARIQALDIEAAMHESCGDLREAIRLSNQMIGLREALSIAWESYKPSIKASAKQEAVTK